MHDGSPSDAQVYLYMSLTSGSVGMMNTTSRLESMLKGAKIYFKAIDLAGDERARKLWRWKGGSRKLPALVSPDGEIIGDMEQLEDANEEGRLRDFVLGKEQ